VQCHIHDVVMTFQAAMEDVRETRRTRVSLVVGEEGYPLMLPIGRSSATFLVIPARSTVSTTSEIFL